MMRSRYLFLAILTLTCALVVAGCAKTAPTTAPPQPPPTDTVVYNVPTAPASPTARQPMTAGPTGAPAPPTTGAVTAPPPEGRGPLPQTRLTIMHTNDSRGYLDPCGWGIPKGGVARRATVIKDARKEEGRTVLVLDAGDTLLGQPISLQSEGAAIVEAMNAMGYDAMAVGRLDLAKGVDVVVQRAREARFAILSCNLVRKGTREPILSASTVIERDGMRYGILGVTEPEALQSPGVADVADVLDPVETVRAALPDLQARSDVIIVLSHLGLDLDRSLAEAVPGIDIIIGGRTREVMRMPELVDDTIITQMGYDGEFLGRLDVSVNEDGRLSDPAVTLITLTPDYADDPELTDLVWSLKSTYAEPTRPAP